jgi:hypothetical protein
MKTIISIKKTYIWYPSKTNKQFITASELE